MVKEMLDTLYYQELSKCSAEITEGKGDEKKEREELLGVVQELVTLCDIARKKGLLELEDHIKGLPAEGVYPFLFEMIEDVTLGVFPEMLKEFAYCRYFSSDLHGYRRLTFLIFLSVTLSIQVGENPYVIERRILSTVPEKDREDCRAITKQLWPDPLSVEEKMEQLFEGALSVQPDNAGYDMIKTADDLIAGMDKRTAEAFLRQVENHQIAILLKVLSGEARKVILTSVSKNLASMLIEDMEYMGPIRKSDALSTVKEIMNVFVRLRGEGYILSEDPDLDQKLENLLQAEKE